MADTNSIMRPTGQKDLTRRTVLGGLTLAASTLALPIPEFEFANLSALDAGCLPHPVSALPFVRTATEDEKAAGAAPRDFWAVSPSGDYATDCGTGAHYASLAVDYMSATRSPHMLGWVVADMMALQRSHSGIEVGFASVFSRLATEAHAARLALREGGLT
jgi:hypothetical protein